MGMLFRNWLEEGYYEEDGYGDLTRVDEPDGIFNAREKGTLFYNKDGITSKVNDNEEEY